MVIIQYILTNINHLWLVESRVTNITESKQVSIDRGLTYCEARDRFLELTKGFEEDGS